METVILFISRNILKFFLIFIAGFLLFASFFNNVPWYMTIAIFLFVSILLCMVIAYFNIRKISLLRNVPDKSVVGQSVTITAKIKNSSLFFPANLIMIRDSIGMLSKKEHYIGALAEQIPAGGTISLEYSAQMERRGTYQVSNVLINSCYPYGLFFKQKKLSFNDTIKIYPAIHHIKKLPYLRPSPSHKERAVSSLSVSNERGEFAGLREYNSGDGMRLIEWKRSAAVGKLLVKQYDRNGSSSLSICIEHSVYMELGDKFDSPFESAISIAASIASFADKHSLGITFWDNIAGGLEKQVFDFSEFYARTAEMTLQPCVETWEPLKLSTDELFFITASPEFIENGSLLEILKKQATVVLIDALSYGRFPRKLRQKERVYSKLLDGANSVPLKLFRFRKGEDISEIFWKKYE